MGLGFDSGIRDGLLILPGRSVAPGVGNPVVVAADGRHAMASASPLRGVVEKAGWPGPGCSVAHLGPAAQ